jgi:hypothetical protein
MTHRSRINRFTRIGLFAAIFVFLTQMPHASAQQQYVARYDVFTGFSDLYTPGLNHINQVGFHLQAGINNNRWLSSGFDYSVQTGNTSLVPSFASPAIKAGIMQLYEEYALTEGQAGLPPTYAVNVPLSATTQTFTAGSQLNYRHFSKVTLFIRPSLAAFRLTATAHPRPGTPDEVVVGALIATNVLQPNNTITDWTGAYGVGGGAEFALAKHFGIRADMDAVWNHPFNYVVANGGWSWRYSIGPSFHFGRNVLTPHVQKVK